MPKGMFDFLPPADLPRMDGQLPGDEETDVISAVARQFLYRHSWAGAFESRFFSGLSAT